MALLTDLDEVWLCWGLLILFFKIDFQPKKSPYNDIHAISVRCFTSQDKTETEHLQETRNKTQKESNQDSTVNAHPHINTNTCTVYRFIQSNQ